MCRNLIKIRSCAIFSWFRSYFDPISCCCDCPSSGSLIFGGQIVHINEGKGKLALLSTKDSVLLTPHPSCSSAIDLFSLFNFTFFSFLNSLLFHNFIISLLLLLLLLLLHMNYGKHYNERDRRLHCSSWEILGNWLLEVSDRIHDEPACPQLS